jgi:hypothetical protein
MANTVPKKHKESALNKPSCEYCCNRKICRHFDLHYEKANICMYFAFSAEVLLQDDNEKGCDK